MDIGCGLVELVEDKLGHLAVLKKSFVRCCCSSLAWKGPIVRRIALDCAYSRCSGSVHGKSSRVFQRWRALMSTESSQHCASFNTYLSRSRIRKKSPAGSSCGDLGGAPTIDSSRACVMLSFQLLCRRTTSSNPAASRPLLSSAHSWSRTLPVSQARPLLSS